MRALSTAIKIGTIIPRLAFTIFGLFFAFIGMKFVADAKDGIREVKAMQHWQQTTCIIESNAIKDHSDDFRLDLEYMYVVNDKEYRSSRYSDQQHVTASSMGDISEIQKKYPLGHKTSCHYNPRKPSEAVLALPTVSRAKSGARMTYIFPAFGIIFAILPWLTLFGKKRDKVETHKNDSKGKMFLFLFGAVFLMFGLGFLYPIAIKPLLQMQASKEWAVVPATVVSSKVKTHSDSDGTTYSVYIAYRYSYNDEEFICDQYSFMGGSDSHYKSKKEKVRKHPKGKVIEIYVNPENPSEAVIERTLSWSMLFALIPLVFVLVGGGIMIAAFRVGKTRKLDQTQAREQIISFKGKSPIPKLVTTIIFALVWNGIVVILFKSDAPIFFGLIFGVFGLIIIGGVIHALLNCFNPRPTVEITPGNLLPGSSGALRWTLSGSTERIQRLEIILKCFHVTTVTRRRGGESETSVEHTEIFAEEVFSSSTSIEIPRGAVNFNIPEDQPASRNSKTDGYEWQFFFHADIPKWPDIKEELKFLVYPSDQ